MFGFASLVHTAAIFYSKSNVELSDQIKYFHYIPSITKTIIRRKPDIGSTFQLNMILTLIQCLLILNEFKIGWLEVREPPDDTHTKALITGVTPR